VPSKGALRVSTRSEDSASSSKEYSDVRTPRTSSKLSSSKGLLRVNSKNRADGTASTTEPADDLLNSGLLSYEPATPRTPRAPDPQVEAMKEIARLRRELMIPMESMQAAMKLFRQHATVPQGSQVFTDGELTKPNLASVMRQMSGSADDVIETCLVDNAFTIADKDENGTISFYEFAIWYSSHSFDEHFNLDARELELRKLSRQLDMPMSEIDTYRRHFDSFDTDGNGTMDRTEFYDMLLKCLKVPKHIGIPANRVQQMWADADTDHSGVIEFIEFVVFFAKYFGNRGMDGYYSKNGLVNALHGR
jgi:Ca2+-binding EF-hand superfamily protein